MFDHIHHRHHVKEIIRESCGRQRTLKNFDALSPGIFGGRGRYFSTEWLPTFGAGGPEQVSIETTDVQPTAQRSVRPRKRQLAAMRHAIDSGWSNTSFVRVTNLIYTGNLCARQLRIDIDHSTILTPR